MSKFDEQYIDLCHRILDHGDKITTDVWAAKFAKIRAYKVEHRKLVV